MDFLEQTVNFTRLAGKDRDCGETLICWFHWCADGLKHNPAEAPR